MMSILMFNIGVLILSMLMNLNLKLIFIQNLIFMLMFILMFFLISLKYYNYWMFIYMDFGVDKMSILMIFLTLWIIGLMFLSIIDLINLNYLDFLIFQLIVLLMSLMMFFYSMDLINFYLLFEISLIPVLLMILGWGIQPERIQAGIYMMIYTLVASLPFFILLMLLKFNLNSMNLMILIYDQKLLMMNSLMIFFFLNFMFLVKLPIYMVHLWLPKAHVEAPVFGSMILAGIMLKLGGYGMYRVMMIFYNLLLKYNLMSMIFIFIGALNISILCLRQIDLKMLIAYSSVVHMGFMIVGMMTLYSMGMMAGLLMMIGHGLCSSGLFCLLNFSYKRLNSRSLFINKGLINMFSSMSMWWFMFCVINMAAPSSLNLVSEILLIMILIKYNYYFIIFIFIISFFSGVYSIFLYSYSQHGKMYFFNNLMDFNLMSEYLLMILHWIPLNFLILVMWYI